MRTVDYPTMRGLTRIASYTNYRVEKQAMGDAPLPFSYMELFDIPDIARLPHRRYGEQRGAKGDG